MWCPHCQSLDLKVVDSRPAAETTRRRRHCNSCNLRFTTFERVEQFICPSCQSPNSRVRTRELASGVTIRQRECLGCRARFETRENAQTSDLMVVKRDLRRERFDRSKIVASVRVATAKLPVPTARIDRLVDDVVVDITPPRSARGPIGRNRLDGHDQVARGLVNRIRQVRQRIRIDH